MEFYPIIIRAWAHKMRTTKVKTPDDDWSTNLHAVANGGHGPSLEYHPGEFSRSLEI